MAQKSIIIIGATSGIGREIACIYAEKGWRVGITGRRMPLLLELKDKYPGNIYISCFDVRTSESSKKIEALIQCMGGLDILLYNAGYGKVSDELSPEIEEHTVQTNVSGFIRITATAFQYFVQQGYGQLAFTSSIAALRGNGRAPAYSASKAFISIYAEGLQINALRLKKKIIITDLKPGFIATKMASTDAAFWVASASKAARQIVRAIEKRKRVAYITRRWILIAFLLKVIPFGLYKRFA